MSTNSDELVLVVPDAALAAAGRFLGFRPHDDAFADTLLDPAGFSFRPRSQVETDPSFKQLIPYVVLTHGETVFHYARGAAGTETRLHARRSVGVGGHVGPEDGPASADPYRAGLVRELNEELAITTAYRERLLGYVHDDRTPVGAVHVGIVHVRELDAPAVAPREAAIADAGFAPLAELLLRLDEFETWSRFVLEYLAAGNPAARSA